MLFIQSSVYAAAYTNAESAAKKNPPTRERGGFGWFGPHGPYALASSAWAAPTSEPRVGGRTIKATTALAAMIAARM